jgi:hypothetical protein
MKIRREIMNNKFGTFIFWGGFIGGLSGLLLGVTNGNLLLGWVGILVGIFLGWFVGAINQEKQINNKK